MSILLIKSAHTLKRAVLETERFSPPFLKATSRSSLNGTDMAKLCNDELFVVDLNNGISARKKSWVMKPTFERAKSKFAEETKICFNSDKSFVENGRLYFLTLAGADSGGVA
jgi:hypothetical protein